jgi:glyoxylase I family protein
MKIHHIAIIVSDINKSLEFYSSVLGFEVKEKTFRKERNSWKVDIFKADIHLELFTFPASPPRASYPESLGLRHLSFGVDDIEKCYQEMKSKQVSVEEIRLDSSSQKRFFFFADPDQLPLEIYEN